MSDITVCRKNVCAVLQGMYCKVCIARCVLQGVYYKVCITRYVLQGMYYKVCIARYTRYIQRILRKVCIARTDAMCMESNWV